METTPANVGDATATVAGARRLPAVVRLVRPRQWLKNVLVLAAPFAAGDLLEDDIPVRTGLALVAFCLVSSGIYCLNDARDHDADRAHPTKRRRPVAAGEVGIGAAVAIGGSLVAGGLALGAAASAELVLVLAAYLGVQLAYGFRLKDVPVFDIACVASGFVLRAVAGGAAAEVEISQWFLLVAGFGSLFIVTGKRAAEHAELGVDAGTIRSTLGDYSIEFLRFVRAIAAGACLVAYCLWAFERPQEVGGGEIWYELSIIPFVLAILHYALRVEQGAGAAPEELVLRDRTLQVLGVCWIVIFGLGVHAGG